MYKTFVKISVKRSRLNSFRNKLGWKHILFPLELLDFPGGLEYTPAGLGSGEMFKNLPRKIFKNLMFFKRYLKNLLNMN